MERKLEMKSFANFLFHQLKFQYKTLIAWSLILGSMSLLVGYSFSLFEDAGYFQLLENLPDYIVRAFLGDGEIAMAGTIEGFLALEYFSWMVLMFSFYPFIVGTAAIASEIENNTIESLMAKPISRTEFYWGKVLTLTICIFVFILFNFIALWAGMMIIDESLSLAKWAGAFAVTILSVLSLTAMSFFFSSVFNQSKVAMTAAIAIGLVQYLVNMILTAVDKASWARWTIFYHADVSQILYDNTYPVGSSIYILVIALVFIISGWIVFVKKDIV